MRREPGNPTRMDLAAFKFHEAEVVLEPKPSVIDLLMSKIFAKKSSVLPEENCFSWIEVDSLFPVYKDN